MRSYTRFFTALMMTFTLVLGYVTPSLAVGGLTGTLSGTVIDTTGKAVPNAAVAIAAPTGSYRTTTDSNGRFSLGGVVVDTYTLTITKAGFDVFTQPGVTIIGDQTVNLGNVTVGQALKRIGTTRANSAGAAFQPTQTQDSFTFSGQQITEALGKNFSTDQTQLIASSPGTEIDKNGNLSVRGALATETGLNFDGIDYTQVDHGGATNIFLNGIGSVSVNPGAGDATQGTTGAGVINLVPKRGTRPAFGTFDVETTGPYFNHQLGFEYGFASPNNKISNYISFTGRNFNPAYGKFGSSAVEAGNTGVGSTFPLVGIAYQQDRDFLNNLVYRFGNNNDRSLQLLYQTHWDRETGGVGGLTYPYADSSPFALQNVLGAPDGYAGVAAQIGPVIAGQNAGNYFGTAPNSENDNTESLIKLEYDQNFGSSTFLALRLYQISQESASFDPNGTLDAFNRAAAAGLDGGHRGGAIAELTHQFGKHNVTFNAKYEVQRSSFALNDSIGALIPAFGYSSTAYSFWQDFALPANTSQPLTFGGANDCSVAGGCWLYYLNTTKVFPNGQANPDYGYFKNGIPRIPLNFLASPANQPQQFAVSLRDQWTVTPKLNVDYGLRYEGQNNHLPSGALTGDPGPDNQTNIPREAEPRVAVAYQLGANDAVRASYGRSAEFQLQGVLYTPLDYQYYLNAYPKSPTSLPGSAGTDANFTAPPFNPAPTYGYGCGSGEAGNNGFPFRACTSYADLIRWSEDYFYPDNGNARTSFYNNYDFTYSHRFGNGWSVRATPFYRRGYNIIFYGVVAFTIDPVTGGENPLSFRPVYTGFTQATGAELYLTTPQRPTGLSGYLSATYTNAFSNRPAGSPGEDTQPIISDAVLKAGNAYRVGFLSPFVANVGVQYKTKSGFRINPVLRYDRGFPYGSGNTTPIVINGVAVNAPSTNIANQVPAISSSSNDAVNYVDPTNPGTALKPNIYATRGTPESSSPGGVLTKPRLFADLTLELSPGNGKNTFGLQIQNLFNLFYAEPTINTRYAPIATGVSTYQTGQTRAALDPLYSSYGTSNFSPAQFGNQPYVLYPNKAPTAFRAYYQLSL